MGLLFVSVVSMLAGSRLVVGIVAAVSRAWHSLTMSIVVLVVKLMSPMLKSHSPPSKPSLVEVPCGPSSVPISIFCF